MFLTSDSSFANHTSSGCVKTGGISIWQWLTQRRRSLALEKLGFREIRRSLEFWGLTYYQCRLDVAVHMVLTWPHDLQTVTGSERIWSRCEPTALYHLRTDSRRGAASLDLHHLTYSTPVAWLRLLKPRCSLFDLKLVGHRLCRVWNLRKAWRQWNASENQIFKTWLEILKLTRPFQKKEQHW